MKGRSLNDLSQYGKIVFYACEHLRVKRKEVSTLKHKNTFNTFSLSIGYLENTRGYCNKTKETLVPSASENFRNNTIIQPTNYSTKDTL